MALQMTLNRSAGIDTTDYKYIQYTYIRIYILTQVQYRCRGHIMQKVCVILCIYCKTEPVNPTIISSFFMAEIIELNGLSFVMDVTFSNNISYSQQVGEQDDSECMHYFI